MNRIVASALAVVLATFAFGCSGSSDGSSSDETAGALERGAVGGNPDQTPAQANKKVRHLSGTFGVFDATLVFELTVCPEDTQSDIYRMKAWFRTTPKAGSNATPDDMILSSPRRYISYEGYDAEGNLGYRLADPEGGFSTSALTIDQFEGAARKQVKDTLKGSVKDTSVEPSADLLKACKRSPLPLIKE